MVSRAASHRGERARVADRVRRSLTRRPGPGESDFSTAESDDDDEPGLWSRSAAHGRGRDSRLRLDPGRRSAAALGLVALLAAVVTGVWVFSSRPHSAPVGASEPGSAGSSSVVRSTGSAADTPAPTGSASGSVPGSPSVRPVLVVVDVAGKVRRPGLYRLAAGSRVADALAAAGGALPGTDLVSLDLAATVSDGEEIVVGVAGVAPVSAGPDPAAGPGGAATPGPSNPVDLNTASLEQLETLPGIGPALAQRILDWRAAHGRFSSVTQLNDVAGIGDTRYAQLRPLVSV